MFSPAQRSHRFFPTFARWAAEDARAFPSGDAVLCLGSSSMVMWRTIARDLAPLEIIHRGFGGSTMRDVLVFKDFFARYRARRVVIYEGDNDLVGRTTPEQFLAQCREFVEYLRCRRPDAEFWFIPPKPSPRRWKVQPKFRRAAALLREWQETDPAIHVIDVAPAMLDSAGKVRTDIFLADRLHMNAKGYAIWTRLVRRALLGPRPRLKAVGAAGAWLGFDLVVEDRSIVRVRFGSNARIRARDLTQSKADGALSFAGLYAAQDAGVVLGPDSFVRVRPGPADDPYPFVDFRIDVRAFNRRAWQKANGGPSPSIS